MAEATPIEISQGETFDITVTPFNADETPIDLTGFSAWFRLRRGHARTGRIIYELNASPESPSEYDTPSGIAIEREQGIIKIRISAADTEEFNFGSAGCEIGMQIDEQIYRLYTGTAVVT